MATKANKALIKKIQKSAKYPVGLPAFKDKDMNLYLSFALNARDDDGELIGEVEGDGDAVAITLGHGFDDADVRLFVKLGTGTEKTAVLLQKVIDRVCMGNGLTA